MQHYSFQIATNCRLERRECFNPAVFVQSVNALDFLLSLSVLPENKGHLSVSSHRAMRCLTDPSTQNDAVLRGVQVQEIQEEAPQPLFHNGGFLCLQIQPVPGDAA